MGFDLTGYEKDNNMTMTSFVIYTSAGTIALLLVVAALSFYFFIEREKMYDQIVLQGGVEESIDFKVKQNRILNSYGNQNDDGVESSRIPINNAIEKALEYYND
tara:strand:+ start:1648 stop:1959 length:312 start_codon:yes stop_codon:yes gene_type:complete